MTTLEMNLDEKQHIVDGKLTQAKGIVKEQLGHLQNEELTRLAGKKDQVVGHVQAKYGDSWVMRHRGWVLAGTAVTFFGGLLAIFLSRNKSDSTQS